MTITDVKLLEKQGGKTGIGWPPKVFAIRLMSLCMSLASIWQPAGWWRQAHKTKR